MFTKEMLNKVVWGEEGAALTEYALLIALIAVVSIAAITAVGAAIVTKFWTVSGGLGGATS